MDRPQIQLYVKVSDLISTEPMIEQTGENHYESDYYKDLLASVKKDGIKNCLLVDPSGYICRGNTRKAVAEELGIEYVPIDLGFFCGLFYQKIEDFRTTLFRAGVIKNELSQNGIHNHCKPIYDPNPLPKMNINYNPKTKKHDINFTDVFVYLDTDRRIYNLKLDDKPIDDIQDTVEFLLP